MKDLIASPGFWGIVGVILGFVLAEGAETVRRCVRINRLKKAVTNELQSLASQITLKIEIIEQAMEVLRKKNLELLATTSIPFITKVYEQHFGELSEHYTPVERNCIHNIYERALLADRVLDSFEREFIDAIQTGKLKDPYETFLGKLDDTKIALNTAQSLTNGLLVGQPDDVYGIKEKA